MDITKDRWSYVRDVRPLAGHRLALTFEDGRRGVYDMTPLLKWGVYATLKNPATFDAVRVAGGTATWPGDIDISPEELYYNCEPVAVGKSA